jgi:glutamate formiminotransferase
MSLIAIPNVSEGTRASVIEACRRAIEEGGARVLDVHSDAVHNRSVFTVTGTSAHLADALSRLAVSAAAAIDLTQQRGVHPRIGALDVAPVVPHGEPMERAVITAHSVAQAIGERAGLPVYLYGDASVGDRRELPDLRRGGMNVLITRSRDGFHPDFGPRTIDPMTGVVCVGAREVLIAFNVWMRGAKDLVAEIARSMRTAPGVRALALAIEGDVQQVSMNLTSPGAFGIDAAFHEVDRLAQMRGLEVTGTEIVGLVPDRFRPDPDAKAARLLFSPGRSLESVL